MVISETAYLAILAAIAAERCFELALSRRNARQAFGRGGIEAGKSHYPAIVIVHVLFLASCVVESLLREGALSPILGTIGLIGAVSAQAIRYWAVHTLGDRWNTRIIVVPGESPVTGGPFRFLRHPNYLAVVIELICLPLIRGLWITAVIFSIANAIVLFVRIPAEERAMGEKYAETFAAQPRLIPRIAPTSSALK